MTGKGFRYRTRCCRNTENASGDSATCNDDQEVIECTPRECINVQCNCDGYGFSESFGLKNGICSS